MIACSCDFGGTARLLVGPCPVEYCIFSARSRKGFNWDKSRSTAASAPTVSPASARKGTCGAFAKRAGHKVVAVLKETASGADNGRPERANVLALARARKIDAILVTELSRWGRSTQDLVQTLDDMHGWKVASWLRPASASISALPAAS